jgi:hypothetical protein
MNFPAEPNSTGATATMEAREIKIFTGRAHPALAREICD